MACVWCGEDGKCKSNDEANCDFKTLKKEPEAIKQRMDEEYDKIIGIMAVGITDGADLIVKRAQIKDKLEGIRVMQGVYESEFKQNYQPKDRMAFTKAYIEFMIAGKRMERKKK